MRKNSSTRIATRRKGALDRRQKDIHHHREQMKKFKDEKDIVADLKRKLEIAEAEVATLTSRLPKHSYTG